MFGMAKHPGLGQAPLDGAVIRAARERVGLSLREVSRQIGTSPATLSAVELGRTALTVDRLHRIATVLGVRPQDLLAGPDRTAPTQCPAQHGDWRSFPPLDLGPVLDSAIATFVRIGYHGSTMREIARGANMSVAGLYHHYASKQQILVAILDRTMSDLRWRVIAAQDESEVPRERFARMVEALALFHATRRDLAFIGASEMRSLEEPERARIAGLRNDVQYLFDAVVAVAVDTGEFRTPYPHDAARAVSTMCTSLPQWFRGGGPSAPDAIASEYAQFAVAVMLGVAPVG